MEVYSEVLRDHVKLPDVPRRIVSLAPSITETLVMLGLEGRIVGVSRFCHELVGVRSKVEVGDYMNVDYELLDSIKPDLILSTTGVQLRLSVELYEKGYPVYPIPLPTVTYDILSSIVNIGRIVGVLEEAWKLASNLNVKLSKFKRKRSVKGYYEVDLEGPITVGRFSYITSSLKILGVDHVYSHLPRTYFKPDYRELSRFRDLEVILYELHPRKPMGRDEVIELLASRGLEGVRALELGRVIVLPPNTLTHYGPSHISKLERLSKVLKNLRRF